MPGSLPQKQRRTNTARLLTAFIIYCAMIAGLLAFVTIFPDSVTQDTQAESARAVTATKPARYEGVIANWNRYRARDALADVR
jgi:Flp pilus assembly protein protease CpaA